MYRHDRVPALLEVGRRTFADIAGQGDRAIEAILAEALYHEKKRAEQGPESVPGEQRTFWREAYPAIMDGTPEDRRNVLQHAIDMYAHEIAGHLDPRVFDLSTRLIPAGFTLMLNAVSLRALATRLPRAGKHLSGNIVAQGHTEALKRLHQKGRIVLVPTHASHLDSIVVGWLLYELGLPPFAYGAGLNLFTNPMLSFVMHNNGAYKVDRKKRFDLYKRTLKHYCTVSLEFGYDNLFFPGGTRSRSGAIETHLKLGLLGSALRAYQGNLRARRSRPNLYIIPATLSYHLVLEAETLIDDHLQDVGRSRYIIENDESTRPGRVFEFIRELFSLDSRIYCSFGRPLDPFGNDVDEDGTSRDGRGRPIDIARYVMQDGRLHADDQRDWEYTRLLGERIVERYLEENTVLATQMLAGAMWRLLEEANPDMDFYRIVRTGGRQRVFPRKDVLARLEAMRNAAAESATRGKLHLDPRLSGVPVEEVLDEALRHFSSYHTRPVVEARGDWISAGDPRLVLYYRNRLESTGLLSAP